MMLGRTLFEGVALTTQEPEAVNALAAYLGMEISSDGVLDLASIKLVKSNKGDSFYTVTATGCSCPSATYRGSSCKHQRRLFGAKPQSQPVPEMERGAFRPCLPEDEEQAVSSPVVAKMLIDCHDTRMRDVSYWQNKQAQEA